MGINPTNPEIARIIRIKANKLVGRHGVRRSDVEDIQQDLIVHLLERGQQLIAHTAGQMTVLDLALENAIKNLLEKRCAKKRDRRREVHLDDAPFSCLASNKDPIAELILQMDLDALIAELPVALIPLVKELYQGVSPADARHNLGYTRGKLRHQMLMLTRFLSSLKPDIPDNHISDESGQ